ncbi:MAG: methyltransferase domain-containing protein [Zoogloea sp.]|nr:methyltransferase domain-containing protein [Zoogloea sp.]
MAWQPDQYLKFSDERLRPALDLLGRIRLASPGRIVDLGCGAGNVTRLLKERWPDAGIVGVDSSPEMLARAAQLLPEAEWVESDIRAWSADGRVDLIFSNAALHWIDDQEVLLRRLVDALPEGGVLAVQMPGNFDAPSHRLIRELAASAPWSARLGSARMGAVRTMAEYYGLLAPRVSEVQLWETTYWQALSGDRPVLEWLRGTTLLPYLGLLTEAEQAAFLDVLQRDLAKAYPCGKDGVTLFPFRRIFLLATR